MIRAQRDRRVPGRLAKLVTRGLATAPEDRHPSLAVLADELGKTARPRAPIVAAAGAAIAVVAAGLWWGLHPAADSCEASASIVDDVWGPPQRFEQLAHFSVLRPRELPMIEASTRLVDDWADAWRLGRRSACSVAEPQRTARIGCLDQQLAELRAQVAVWRTADRDVVDRALATAAALPQPAACATHTAAAIDPDTIDKIALLKALERAGKHKQAQQELPALVAAVERSPNPATVAAGFVAVARIEFLVGELGSSRAHYSRAAKAAAVAGDDATLFAAMVGEAAVIVEQGRAIDAIGIINSAEALALRAKLDRSEEIALARGAALTAAGRQAEALSDLERGLAAVTVRAARDPSARASVAIVLGAMASAETHQYHYKEAHDLLSRALQIEQSIYGAEHPELAKTLHDLGLAQMRLGDFNKALAYLQRARAGFVAAYGERHVHVATADLTIANTLLNSGKPEDARPYYARAWETLSAILPEDSPLVIAAEQSLAVFEDRLGNCDVSIPHHQHAIAMMQRNGTSGPDIANEQLNLAGCLADRGRLVEARKAAEAGVAGIEAAGVSPIDHCQPWMVEAEVAWLDGRKPIAIALWRKILATCAGVDRPDIKQVLDYVGKMLADATK